MGTDDRGILSSAFWVWKFTIGFFFSGIDKNKLKLAFAKKNKYCDKSNPWQKNLI